MAMKKMVNGFTNTKKDFFVFYVRFADGDKHYHIAKDGNRYKLKSSYDIKSTSKQKNVIDFFSNVVPIFNNLMDYDGVISAPYKKSLSPIEDFMITQINNDFIPMGDITYVRNKLPDYNFSDYTNGESLLEPVVDRLVTGKDVWNDDEIMMNKFFRDKTKMFVKPEYFETFLLAYRYLTEGALMLEGNFGVGKSFVVEALANLDKRLASTTVISSMREGDLLGKVSALPDGTVGLILSEIVSSLKKGYTVSVEEPNVNEFVQSLRQTFDGKYYLTINGQRQFIKPEGLAVFSINSRRFVGQSDKVTKDLDNRFASRIAFSLSVRDLTSEDITQRLMSSVSTPFDWSDYKNNIHMPNRNIRYFGANRELFLKTLSDFLVSMSKDMYASKYISYYQPYLVGKYFSMIANSHDLSYDEFRDLIHMATLSKIRWNSINEASMQKTEEDIKKSMNWDYKVKQIWNVYPFKRVDETIVKEIKLFGEDVEGAPASTPIGPSKNQQEETLTARGRVSWASLDKAIASLEDDADDLLN